MSKINDLSQKLLSGDITALSRAISIVERREGHLELMKAVQKREQKAYVIGLTGPPGSGKSTLVDKLTVQIRKKKMKVGIIAIDPSSPFSGGAVLGDRIRMQDHAGDESVFIRSLGSRGSHGGLSKATRDVVKLYDAFGMDFVLVETVGVGQTELDIMEIANTTLVILTPESGDTVQTMKAGLLEIADIFVVNKSDRSGADKIKAELEMMLMIGMSNEAAWEVPVLSTQANKNVGIDELMNKIDKHRSDESGRPRDLEKKKRLLHREVEEIVLDELRKKMESLGLKGDENPYEIAEKLK